MSTRHLRRAALAILIAAPGVAATAERAPTNWREIVSQPDRLRLRQWRETWIAALASARAGGNQPQIAATGSLLDPDAAMPDVALADGDYDCRTYKLGAQVAGAPTFLTIPAQPCHVAADRLIVDGGMQRPAGRLVPYDESRLIFLGAMALGDERHALDYGRDSVRSMAGMVERIGPRRWRLVVPRPRWQSQIDVIDITPRNDGKNG